MTYPPEPRIAPFFGGLDDAAIADKDSADAWVLSEIERNGNLAKARGGLMYRYLANASADGGDGTNPGEAEAFVWPFWSLAVPLDRFPVPKKPGLTKMRCALRAIVDNGRKISVQITSLGNGANGELIENIAETECLQISGSGTEERYTKDDFRVQSDGGEALSIWARCQADRDNDPLLNTGTYGGSNAAAAGNVQWAAGVLTDNAVPTPWHDVDTGGHYILFLAPADDRIVHIAAVVGVDDTSTSANGEALYFWPPGDPAVLPTFGLNYEIRKLPEWRILSIALYSVDGEP